MSIGYHTEYDFSYAEGFDAGYAKGMADANRWIPCSERLPEKDEAVLIYAARHRVTAFFDAVKGVFRLTESDDLFYLQSAVTHWKPLPEPPESEVQDNDKC